MKVTGNSRSIFSSSLVYRTRGGRTGSLVIALVSVGFHWSGVEGLSWKEWAAEPEDVELGPLAFW